MSASVDVGRWRTGSGAAMIVAGALAIAPGTVAATAPIYKCIDAHLALMYTDQPCADGEQIDIRPGNADPAAAARLAHARDEIERRATARIAEERRMAAQKELATLARRERQEDREPFATTDDTAGRDALTWYPAYLPTFVPTRPSHHRPHRAATPRSISPHEPLFVPRS